MKFNIKKKPNSYLGICVARKNSKGLKNKNTISIRSKPCSYWTLLAAKNSKNLSKVILSTDSKKIINIAKRLNIEVPYQRPKYLSRDNSPIFEVIHHIIQYYKKKKIYYDYFILLQCSSPFRTSEHIDGAIKHFEKNKKNEISSLISVVKTNIKANWLLKKRGKKIEPIFKKKFHDLRRQKTENFFLPNGAIYIADTINFKKNFFSKNTLYYLMDYKSSIDIDTRDDLNFVRKNYE
jgi:N-acylneuraminate cytidylyltransferase/CMP-N,N'-diacetyllegionaminic acid synthase